MLIKEIELASIKQFKDTNVIPVLLQFDDECFEIAYNLKHIDKAWSIFQKIFYYKLSEINKEYFDTIYDIRLFKSEKSKGQILFSKTDKTFKNEIAADKDTAIKFSNQGYIRVEKDGRKYNNLLIFKKILTDTKIKNVKLFVTLTENLIDTNFKKEYNKLKQQISKKQNKKIRIKKGNLVVGHINGLILNDKEKLIKYVRSEYNKRILLGDIILDDKQDEVLKLYMKEQLNHFVNNPTSFRPDYSRLFALGLVRYAMKNYNKRHSGDFWPHFKTEYNVEIGGNHQKILHEKFELIMNRYGKIYDKDAANKIDNITMHCFVADNSAFQLFDYLFDFWRLDLGRNSENLNNEEGSHAFKSLIEAMQKGAQNVMTHTSLLLNFDKTKTSFKNRIKRILRLINDSFWNSITINETGNRINHLLNEWIKNPKYSFQKEKNYVSKHSIFERGEILFHSPVLNILHEQNKLRIILPHQRLIECDENDYPEWKIKCSNNLIEIANVVPEFKHDKIGYYVDRKIIEIPFCSILYGFEFQLISNGNELKKYKINQSNIRLFDEKGKFIDYTNGIVPDGLVYSYSNDKEYPTVLGDKFETIEVDGVYLSSMNLIKGQVIILDDKSGIQVGQKINEGLTEHYPLDGVRLIDNDKEYPIYNSLPKLLFKSPYDQLSGVSLIINGKQNKVVEKGYKEFKLADELKSNGYLIDLNEYIKTEGLYSIEISFPKMHKHNSFGLLAYIKNFSYRFDNAPYIFKDYATIIFDSRMNIVKKNKEDDWKIGLTEESFRFNFGDKKSENDEKDFIDDCRLKLQYNLNDKLYYVYFDIPALYWKYSENDEWNTQKPACVLLKDLSKNINRLYVKGPFNFSNSKLITTDDVDIAEEENEIEYQGNKRPYFDVSKIYNWFKSDRSVTYREIFITIENQQHKFFDVMCKSDLRGVSLIGDFENNILKGEIDIIGNEEYTISIYRDNEIICEDEQIIDGHFQIETEIETGNYQIYVYEIEESDDDGFDVEVDSILLNKQPIVKKLININDLEGKYILLKGYRDHQKKYHPHKFSNKYILRKLRKITYNDVVESMDNDPGNIYGIWNGNIDVKNEEQMKRFVYYKSKLFTCNYNGDLIYLLEAIIIFTDYMNTESILVLTKDENDVEYCSLYIDKQKEKIISPSQRKNMKKYMQRQSECFYDDRNHYLIDIEEE